MGEVLQRGQVSKIILEGNVQTMLGCDIFAVSMTETNRWDRVIEDRVIELYRT